jgi:hypothetical protein
MTELLKRLAFKWCRDYGDKEYAKKHEHHCSKTYAGVYNPWCGNCNDGLSFARDVLTVVRERLN